MLPEHIKPMLSAEAPEPFDSVDHLWEIKWDGIRCVAFAQAGRLRLQSRELIDITGQFPELGCLQQLPDGTVVDGELVAMAGKRPSLVKIQQRAQSQAKHRIDFLRQFSPAVYVVFDLLYLHGQSIMAERLVDRRRALARLVSDLKTDRVILSQGVIGPGRELFRAVAELGLEGVMAKSLAGQYRPGTRTALWKKLKVKGYPQGAARPSHLRGTDGLNSDS